MRKKKSTLLLTLLLTVTLALGNLTSYAAETADPEKTAAVMEIESPAESEISLETETETTMETESSSEPETETTVETETSSEPETETTAETEHHYVSKVEKKATCTENGLITYTCDRCGDTYSKVIYYPETIELSKTKYTYNGKVIKPSVSVKDSSGKKISSENYDVTYPEGCKNAGTYEVKITFKGNYSGKASRSYTIGKAKQTISVSDVTKTYGAKAFSCGAKLTKGKGSLSYKSSNTKVAKISSKGNITVKGNGKAKITVTAAATANYSKAEKSFYVTVNPSKPGISGIKSPKNGVLKVSWKKVSDITGYQIRYSRNSDMKDSKTVTVSSAKTVSKSISGLSKGKKYYVQVRAYKKSGDNTYKSSWSSKKSVAILNVKLNKTSVTLNKGKTVQLSISGTKNKVSWSSSKTSVATVSKSGKVTAKSAGKATITAKVGGNSYTCKITVKAAKKSGSLSDSDTVLITKTGECYHTHKCGNGTYYKTTYADAKKRGLRACKKCFK